MMIGARCCAAGQRSARRERLTDTRGCANECRESESEEEGAGGGGRGREQNHDARPSCQTLRATTNTQEAGAHVAMGDKKCGHAVAHGDAVCARVCAEGRRANSNAQQADVVHREGHSRARAARGGERREEGGRIPTGRTAGAEDHPKDNCGVGRAATAAARAIKICARRASKRRRRDEWDGRGGCGGARRRAGGGGRRPARAV